MVIRNGRAEYDALILYSIAMLLTTEVMLAVKHLEKLSTTP